MDNINNAKWFKYLKFIAVTILPVIYIGVFLNSMWNPYKETNHLPIAIVNEDKTVRSNNGAEIKAGEEFQNTLMDSSKIDAKKYSDNKKAEDDLKSGKITSIIRIPSEFSDNINNLKTTEIESSMLSGQNYTQSKMLKGMIENVTNSLNTNLVAKELDQIKETSSKSTEDISKALQSGNPQIINQVKEQLSQAGNNQLSPSSQLVKVKFLDKDEVTINGVGMYPYMVSIATWVFSVAVVVTTDIRGKLKPATQWLKGLGTFAILTVISQLLVFGLLKMQHKNFDPNYMGKTSLILFAGGMAFISIVWILRFILGIGGIWASLIILFTQISVAGGTYPLRLSSKLYQNLHEWFPMSYLVDGLRQTVSLDGDISSNLTKLIAIIIISNIILFALYYFEDKTKKSFRMLPDL